MLYKIILMIKTLLAKKVETSVIRIFKINHFKNHLEKEAFNTQILNHLKLK